jgi:uroporphyrinogen decarboxylase
VDEIEGTRIPALHSTHSYNQILPIFIWMEGRPEKTASAKPLLRALGGETLDRPPWWLMRQAGRYLPEYRELRRQAPSFLEFCLDPALASEATLQPVRRFAMDGAILFADILIVPHGLGARVAFREGEGPVLRPVRSAEDLKALSAARFGERVAPIYETVRSVRRALPPAVALIGFAGAPWTVAAYMVEGGTSREFARVKGWAYSMPDSFGRLIDMLVDATVDYLSGQVEAGAEALQLFDSWAGVLPEPGFRLWVIEPTRRIVAELKKRHPDVPVIGFPRGAGLLYPDYVSGTHVDAVGLDTGVPMEAARELQSQASVQGNLDPLMLVTGGTAMVEAVERIRAALGEGPFVFNLGHGVVPETPPDHVAQLAELLRA